jgi:hypothetical protein
VFSYKNKAEIAENTSEFRKIWEFLQDKRLSLQTNLTEWHNIILIL